MDDTVDGRLCKNMWIHVAFDFRRFRSFVSVTVTFFIPFCLRDTAGDLSFF